MITGPSGVGKGTLIRGLLERVPGLELSVSATTRPPRPGEREGVDYHFMTPEQFKAHVAAGDFVEHATYSGNRYGTLRSELERRLRTAERELEAQPEFAHVVFNDRLEDTTDELLAVVTGNLTTD